VREEGLVADLDALLIKAFNGKSSERIGVIAPLEFNSEEVVKYKVSGLGNPLIIPEVTLEAVRSYAGQVDEESVRDSVWIQGYDRSGISVTVKASLYSYLTCEARLGKINYAFAGRKWYRVEANF